MGTQLSIIVSGDRLIDVDDCKVIAMQHVLREGSTVLRLRDHRTERKKHDPINMLHTSHFQMQSLEDAILALLPAYCDITYSQHQGAPDLLYSPACKNTSPRTGKRNRNLQIMLPYLFLKRLKIQMMSRHLRGRLSQQTGNERVSGTSCKDYKYQTPQSA